MKQLAMALITTLLGVLLAVDARAEQFNLEGRVVDARGKGVKNATVSADWRFFPDGSLPKAVGGSQTAKDGSFRIQAQGHP
jgi:hypothetical protein